MSTFKLHTLEAGLKIKDSRIVCIINESVTRVSITYTHASLSNEDMLWKVCHRGIHALRSMVLGYSALLQTALSKPNTKRDGAHVMGQYYVPWINKRTRGTWLHTHTGPTHAPNTQTQGYLPCVCFLLFTSIILTKQQPESNHNVNIYIPVKNKSKLPGMGETCQMIWKHTSKLFKLMTDP